MDQDDKIRQYVQKKQEQRERAQYLRTQRRTGTQGTTNAPSNHGTNAPPNHGSQQQSFNPRQAQGTQNRLIGDPFASSSNNENTDPTNIRNGSVYNDPYDNNHSHFDDRNPVGNKYRNNTYNNNNNNNAPNDYTRNTNDRYANNTVGKMAPSEPYTESHHNNDDYNDYNNNFNQKWKTPMAKPNANRDNRQFTNQNRNNNDQTVNNNHRGFNRNNNDRNPSNVALNQGFNRNNRDRNDRNDRIDRNDRTDRTDHNDLNEASRASSNDNLANNATKYATATDVQKVVSMVEQLRGQMHALQFQIDNVKMENTKLKQKVEDLEKKQKEEQKPKQKQHFQQNHNNNNNNNNNNIPRNHQNMDGRNNGFNPNNNFNANNRSNDFNTNNRSNDFNSNTRNNSNSNDYSRNNAAFAKASSKMDIDIPSHRGNNNGLNPNNDIQNPQFNFNKNPNNFNPNSNSNSNSNGYNNTNNFNNNNPNTFNTQQQQPNDDEEDIAAPPLSSAADLIAKLEQTQGAFAEEQSVERVKCKQCGRKFARTALERHIRICKKVFGQKRKAFNMKQQRTDDEQINAQRNNESSAVEAELKRKKLAAKKKWKAQSSMLRQAIQSSKQIDQAIKEGKPLSEIPNIPSNIPDDRVPCPHCGRKFAEETAKRHIPKCQNIKSRPKFLKRKR